jgi:glutamate:GABA antiporter
VTNASAVTREQAVLRRPLGLGDLALAQVLCVVGSSWVGIAAKLGRAHVVFWVAAMLLFYLPLAAVVIRLNRIMPLEGGLYQWTKIGFGDMAGFLTAWNLWVYAVIVAGAIIFYIPTDLSYMIGSRATWLPASKPATLLITAMVMGAIAWAAIRGLDFSKWLHNAGSVLIMLAYAILLTLPWWALAPPRVRYEAVPWSPPRLDWFALAVFGQMTVGALSGFEYIAILAGECRSAARQIGQSVMLSAPVICLMFILGTSSVLAFVGAQPVNVIGPIPQTMRAALGSTGAGSWAAPLAIFMVLARQIAAASLIFTGLTRLPMTAGWDHLVPEWFARLDRRRGTPVNSILFGAALVLGLVLLSMLGVREQEASQLLSNASTAHYALAYMGLFALPLIGHRALRDSLPRWLKLAALAGLVSSLTSLAIAVYPIVDVIGRMEYAAKICAVVVVANGVGVLLYRAGRHRTIQSGLHR